MNKKKILTQSLYLALSNKYIEVTIRFLETKVLNVKNEVLFYMIKKSNKT